MSASELSNQIKLTFMSRISFEQYNGRVMKTASIPAARLLTELLRFSSIISFTFDGMHERFDLIVRVPCHSCSY